MVTEKVLIVEADPRVSEVLVVKLSNAGYHVTTVKNGGEALPKAVSFQPDIILLAVNLPGKDGLEVCYEIRQNPSTRRVPIIALLDMEQDLTEYSRMGLRFDDQIVKPFHPRDALAKVHALLAHSRSLKEANRLTGLPGKQQLELEVREKLELGAFFHMLFIDLKGFTAYNRYYGFEAGDEVIKAIGQLIEDVLEELDTTDVFIAHKGGDDFRILLPLNYGERVAHQIIAKFEPLVQTFYKEEDRARGGFFCKNRQGILEQWPIMTISVAQASNEFRKYTHPLELDMVGEELLKYARTIPGNNFVWDRRRDGTRLERVEDI
ncbi:MAG TPA: response regulator [Bacillota bacterium]|nr:response regulator [Bacillota bacterium]